MNLIQSWASDWECEQIIDICWSCGERAWANLSWFVGRVFGIKSQLVIVSLGPIHKNQKHENIWFTRKWYKILKYILKPSKRMCTADLAFGLWATELLSRLVAQKWNWWPRSMPPAIHDVLEGRGGIWGWFWGAWGCWGRSHRPFLVEVFLMVSLRA